MEIKMSAISGGKTGKIGKIEVKAGDRVEAQAVLVQVETGKGNRPIKAPAEGIIAEVLCEEGAEVSSDQVMFLLTEVATMAAETIETQPQTVEKQAADLLIIGGGPGGYVAAIYAAKKGLKVTLVEKASLGGTCLNVGCIPTKALVKSSEICHNVATAGDFGIQLAGTITVDMAKVIARKDEVKNTLVSGIEFLMKKNEIQVIKGLASFVSKNEVKVEVESESKSEAQKSYLITAKDIIVATGSKISKINLPGLDLPFVLNSTTALACLELPKSITIIGGGVIGMEFAFIYKNLGVQVQVIEFMDRLLTMVDPDISQEIYEAAVAKGIKISLASKVLQIRQGDNGQAVVVYENKAGESLAISEKVLVAIGREPNLADLCLEKAEISLDERKRGIKVDEYLQTSTKHIYAIGDVTDIIQLAHVASHQGLTAVDNIIGDQQKMDYSAVPNVIFTAPEIASVGKGEAHCLQENVEYEVARFDFAGNGKALTMNEPRGFVKLIKAKDSNKIIGGSIIGPDAAALISTLTLAIQNGLTSDQIAHTIFAHPTTAEVIHEAALGFSMGALHQ